MKTDRRGFLAALIAAPVLARLAPAACCKRLTGLEHWIHSNTWDAKPWTDEELNLFINEGYTAIYRTPWGPLPKDGLGQLYAGK
jgi:hypothetical protein